MPLSPGDLLGMGHGVASISADTTFDSQEQEYFGRQAVHTAYYAAYHYAKAWADALGFKPKKGVSVHAALWDFFSRNTETAEIGRRGKALKKKRVHADYEPHKTFRYTPADIVEEAQELMDLIKQAISQTP